MKKRLFNIAFASLLTLSIVPTMTSCVDEDLNINPKSATSVPSANLLGNALYQSANLITTPNVNGNNYVFFVQQLSATTYQDEPNYTFNRQQPRALFTNLYVTALGNLRKAKESLATEVNTTDVAANKLATLEISELLVWETLVNTFGNVPYTEAFLAENGNYTPKYDDAKTIYVDLINRLDAVINTINTSAGGYTTGGDLVFYGKMDSWKKTANALKLRLGLNLADTDASLAKQVVESAFQSGVYGSYAEAYNFKFDTGIYFSPYYSVFIASGRSDFTPSVIIMDMMNAKEDARRDAWFTKVNDKFIGGPFGTNFGFNTVSNVKPFFLSKEGPIGVISYTEVQFMLAEAAARGFNVGGTAADYYSKAVTASFEESGIADQAASYLAANPYDATNWQKSIGEEAYVTLFTKGYATWNFTRRLDFPKLVAPSTAGNPLPVRLPYSDQEYLLNGDNVRAAATAIGGDSSGTKLFWDVK